MDREASRKTARFCGNTLMSGPLMVILGELALAPECIAGETWLMLLSLLNEGSIKKVWTILVDTL